MRQRAPLTSAEVDLAAERLADGRASSSAPTATLVVAAFNAEETIGRTLRSFRRQSLRSWEAVVVDDGSTDETAGLVGAISRTDRRIRLIRQDNRGPSAARNVGLEAASGTYVIFVDADDTIAPSYLSRMVRAVERDDAVDAACSGSVRLSRDGTVIERSRPPSFNGDVRDFVRWQVPAPLHALLVRRSVALAAGGFDREIGAHEDWDFWFRLARQGLRVAREDAPLAHYWCRRGSLTRNGPAMIRTYRATLDRVGRHAPSDRDPAARDWEMRLALAASLCWNAAIAIGEDRNTTELLEIAFEDGRLRGRIDAPLLTSSFLGGLTAGSERAAEDHADLWPAISTRCEEFFAGFEARSGSAGLAYGLRKSCEREVVRAARRGRLRPLGSSVGLPLVSTALLRGVAVPDGQDSLLLTVPGAPLALSVPVFGPRVDARTLRRRLLDGGRTELVRFLSTRHRAIRRLEPVLERADGIARPGVRRARALAGRLRRRGIAAITARPPTAPPGIPFEDPTHELVFGATGEGAADVIIRDEAARAERSDLRPPTRQRDPRRDEPPDPSGEKWDLFYAEPDPWGYDTPYEQLKYDRTLAILPEGEPIGRALEVGAAEGRFTERLAPRVGTLVASDISAVALGRAAERCARFGNVEYRQADMFDGELGTGWGLVTASEVLYYMTGGLDQLRRFAARVAGSLAPGGMFVHAHGFSVDDDRRRTGFDWQVPFGAERIAEVFGARPELRLERSVRTPIYRIDLFRRPGAPPADAEADHAPRIDEIPLGSALEARVERQVIWNGAIRTRAEIARRRAFRVPVLMYHRIADAGPAALAPYRVGVAEFRRQLLFLRRRGFRSIDLAEWRARRGGSLEGRPLLITFDDAYVDFHTAAWPLLRRFGFGAHVFVPTDKVGLTADWDRDAGEPAPLMGWDRIRELAAEGVTFGSHLASHPAADCVPSAALLREAVRSRSTLERALGTAVTSIAAPFGATDSRTDGVFRLAGFREGFRAGGGPAQSWQLGLSTPRIEIAGGLDLAGFAARLGVEEVEPPDDGDLLLPP